MVNPKYYQPIVPLSILNVFIILSPGDFNFFNLTLHFYQLYSLASDHLRSKLTTHQITLPYQPLRSLHQYQDEGITNLT